MQDVPLSLVSLLRHGAAVYADSEVRTFDGTRCTAVNFEATADRAVRVAQGLRRLGVVAGDRVATFAWNTQEHLDAYFGVPAMGAVLHTLNVRLHPEQLAYIVNHAGSRVVLVDASLAPVLAQASSRFETVEHYVVIGGQAEDAGGLPSCVGFDQLMLADDGTDPFQVVDERDAALLCYTTGTTGRPKGVAYSHRSIFLHTLLLCSGNLYGFNECDRLLISVPMFHGMAMGVPYAGWMVGADLVLPGRHLQPEPLARLVELERPSWAGAVPVIWNDILRYSEDHAVDLSSLRVLACGGSSVPFSFRQRFEAALGVRIVQGWGMTETNPVAAVNAGTPKHATAAEAEALAECNGRVVPGVEVRVVDEEGASLPWDGLSIGELEVRGPWVTGSYYDEDATDRFHDGWLRTGDAGVIHPKGFIRITDRIKDVIKSGGEWISSLDLEAAIEADPAVDEAAVVGVPDDRWQERPLAVVVVRDRSETTFDDLRRHLEPRVARWWIPEYWAYLESLPRTSVGKVDKKAIRALVEAGRLDVVHFDEPPGHR
jgi:fatty-acyl-CoA synthase